MLDASPDDYESDREALADVQAATESARKRYRERTGAAAVRDEFKGDLSSDAARKTHAQLRRLKLPTLPEIKDKFEQLWREGQDGE